MIISVASGKGGTGKTTVSAGLASVIPQSIYIDCDVEEPNGYLLLHPAITSKKSVYKLLPHVDNNKCDFCGTCVDVCEFNALINLKFEILLFSEMCHSCGACTYFCPQNIITETQKEIGKMRSGVTKTGMNFYDGTLNIGEISAVPLIKKVKENIDNERINIIDSPPGTSCSMVETMKDSDYCILVTESTPFGLNDLKLAVDVVKSVNTPFGVVINKYDQTFEELENYLTDNHIEVLLKIPFDRKIAESYSNGILPVNSSKKTKREFIQLFQLIQNKVNNNGTRMTPIKQINREFKSA